MHHLFLYVPFSPVSMVAGWELLVCTNIARVLLLALWGISFRVKLSLFILSLLIIVFTFSIFVFYCVVLSSPLAIDIV